MTAKLTLVSDARERKQLDQIELFERWKALNQKAQDTQDIRDAIAAGHAWRDWLFSWAKPA